MLFEANENELEKPEKGYGAYLDLTHGISKGNKYKIECKALSGENSTMAFRLWLHDTREAHPVSSSFYKLSDKPKTISLYFAASETNAVRIHLHAKPGFGKIMVKEVTVREVE